MANTDDILEVISKVDSAWENPTARNERYGNILKAVSVKGLRGLAASVEFSWPVVAIAGTNGSGKTTLLQVCSAAFSRSAGGRRYKIGEWVRGALVGETPPVQLPAEITYGFWDQTPTFTVPYLPARTRWNYPRRSNPIRPVEFFGIATFAPRIEQKDMLHYSRKAEILETKDVDRRITESVSRVLGRPYSDLKNHTVGVPGGSWKVDMPHLYREGTSYTEPHMGAGEQKVLRLIQAIENLPGKSLVLLEEPELTLHPDAQVGLAWYLMSVSRRKGHQIIIATHSEQIFESLPQKARILLVRTGSGVEVQHGVPYLRAARELSSTVRANEYIIVVEDEAAKTFLVELLRAIDGDLLRNARIVPMGNFDNVRRTAERFLNEGVRVVGVLDGDQPANASTVVLPGGASPESILISDENIANASASILAGVDRAHERAKTAGIGERGSARDKKIFSALAREMRISPAQLTERLTIVWLSQHRDQATTVINAIRSTLEAERQSGEDGPTQLTVA